MAAGGWWWLTATSAAHRLRATCPCWASPRRRPARPRCSAASRPDRHRRISRWCRALRSCWSPTRVLTRFNWSTWRPCLSLGTACETAVIGTGGFGERGYPDTPWRLRRGLADSRVPAGGADRPRRHGGRVPRGGRAAPAAGGAEDPRPGAGGGRGVPAAVRQGVAGGRGG